MTTAKVLRFCAAACALASACGIPPDISTGNLYTLRDLAGKSSIFPQAITPRGAALTLLSPPYADAAARQAPDVDGLTIFPAFVDAHPAAYVTTEIWDQWIRVWAQPMYQLVTEIDDELGPIPLEGAKPIFSVLPGSRFYSPFWQVQYVIVPETFRPDALTSVAAVLDSKLPLVQGPNVYASICPPDIGPAHAAGELPLRPFTRDALLRRLPDQGWMDGKLINFLHFGEDRFRADDKHIVAETVLYQFALRDYAGNTVPLDLPRVGGTGAFRAPRPVDAPNGIPQFGALWHEFTVIISPRPDDPIPGVFIPKAMTALRAKVAAMMGDQYVPAPGPVAEETPEKDQFVLRVALDQTCFDQGDFPQGCVWLDTQANIENNLPGANFTDTRRFSANALLLFDGVTP